MIKAAPRLLIAGTGSGCGKTTVTCALLQALVDRGEDVGATKCGPDYIDPMFYREIIGADSGNIDLFFTGAVVPYEEAVRDRVIRKGIHPVVHDKLTHNSPPTYRFLFIIARSASCCNSIV